MKLFPGRARVSYWLFWIPLFCVQELSEDNAGGKKKISVCEK